MVATHGRASIPDADADFVQVREHVGRVLVNAVCADPFEFFFSVTAGKDANPQTSRSPGCQKIPHAISNNHRIRYGNMQSLGGREEQIRVRLRALDLVSRDDGVSGLTPSILRDGSATSRCPLVAIAYRTPARLN